MSALTLQIDEQLIVDLQKTASEQTCSVDEVVQKILREHLPHQQNNYPAEPSVKRVFGQHRGLAIMSEDFNHALPDSVWLGDDA